ncbi:LysM peptidoglycan-binding domain-containing protein [Solitalea canadensis]|uniref:Lipoprotein n=1 Tax=Solitalea canadensis (strain ATCC 29591 / DSM 3403 / JCM 21819 / LMG 8368 / NBRC 15130 / NCIMB 12057 / USAM 9D) TaxID=929556 RepID=H8KW52_SOLCM|nr:LysM peptidoglycan-binding domain-containing protein [Solitalea canadensis]AFD07073.1 lipoprotein [Solitalea canadensis DSM 3403]
MKRLGLLFMSVFGVLSIAKATTIDSLGISEYKGKAVILHLVESKENYYSISRKYHVSPSELMEFNDNAPIRIGDTLKINKKGLTLKKGATAVASGKTIEHTVATGETLFAISRKYGVSVEDIINLNGLTDNSVKIGQKLKINSGGKSAATVVVTPPAKPTETVVKVEPKQEEVKVKPTTTPVKTEQKQEVETDENAAVVDTSVPAKVGREIHESGMATWISDNDLNQAKSVALHRTAPIGTIVKITNPMTNKSVYVKVVGNFPESADTKNVLIVISKSAANLLGVRDQKFRIDLAYAM